jgi:hypothetical protein
MRKLVLLSIACLAALACPTTALAQIKIDGVRAGYRPAGEDPWGRFKVGLWTPIYVDLTTGKNGFGQGELHFETSDSEEVGTVYRVPFTMGKLESQTVVGYTKPGSGGGEVKVSIHTRRGQVASVSAAQSPMELGTHLYLTLGARLPDLQEALLELGPAPPKGEKKEKDTHPRYAGYEPDLYRLPTNWFGYDSVDLLVLTTESTKFIEGLQGDLDRSRAIATWVRRGGRLVVSVSWRNQALVQRFLTSPAWQPALPVVIPAGTKDVKGQAVKRLLEVERWAESKEVKPFPEAGAKPVEIADLRPQSGDKEWEVLAQTADNRPLIARMPHGLGSVTLLAFNLEEGPFTTWAGKVDFFKSMVKNLAPRVSSVAHDDDRFGGGRFRGGEGGNIDLTTQLRDHLENFDVKVVQFGWVALFIVLYILVVGPLDYILLKKVFKRLELTWITFPTVVITVSLIAYFTAYALKGSDLKVNKIDLVDIDMRSEVGRKGEPKKAYATGTTWITVLSPRIQSYTVGVEPALGAWFGAEEKEPRSADLVSWSGRPELSGMGAMGRQTSAGFFRRPYEYAADAAGLTGVPIPVWTTKGFVSSWTQPLPALPLEAALVYHQAEQRRDDNAKVTGTLENKLPFDLEDVWLFYRDRCYPLDGGLTGTKGGGGKRDIKLDGAGIANQEVPGWPHRGEMLRDLAPRPFSQQGKYNPSPIVKGLLFHERSDNTNQVRNHAQRRLDQSWRLAQDLRGRIDTSSREVILYARVAPTFGDAETVNTHPDRAPATRLWLSADPDSLPGPGKSSADRPELSGQMMQDTYVRIIIPVRPAE